MQLSLRSLQDARTHFEKQYEPSLFPDAESDVLRVVSPVRLSFDVDRQESARYRVAGHLSGALELMCSRCLEPFRFAVATDFDLRYVPRTENAGEGEQEVEEDDLATAFYSDDQIDLGQLVMEQLHLALPMKALCRETCKGLCPQCGTNLNAGSCECSPTWEDPRLAALRHLKK
jgi:uncharacterized metal-binding protein YceD (DUF177 family)